MDLFSELPYDIVEAVLTFIPAPDLCRYRTVSKEWNELISNLNFAVVHAENHAKCQDASFIVLHYVKSSKQSQYYTLLDSGWCILDVNARRWYGTNGNTRCRVRFEGDEPRRVLLRSNLPMAMDGGLVCQHFESGNEISLLVHNPIGNYNSATHLPRVPKHETAEAYAGLNLVFDTIAKTFQAFVINHNYDKTIKLNDPTTSEEERLRIRNDPAVHVYDSATKEWQSLSNPDWDISVVGHLLGNVIFQDHLVLLFSDRNPAAGRNPGEPCKSLWTYSLAAKTWKIKQVDDINRYDPKLVVSANRLFLMSLSQKRPHRFCFFLEEITIPEITLERVCNLSVLQVVSWFDIRSGNRVVPMLDERFRMSVIGFGNSSLMVMSNSSGKCKVFDVVTHSWNADDLPQNPLGLLRSFEDCEWVGKHMNLLMRNWKPRDKSKEFKPVWFRSAC